jgi:hypothetical protein
VAKPVSQPANLVARSHPCPRRRGVTPQRGGQFLERHHVSRARGQSRQYHPLANRGDREYHACGSHIQRAKQSELRPHRHRLIIAWSSSAVTDAATG